MNGGAPPSSPSAQLIADRYEILGLLGVGGMGSVYRARDRQLDEVVALKLMRREILDQPVMRERFRNEVKLARRVTHRNVARTFDIGEHAGESFLTMEYVDGQSLAALVAEGARLDLARVVDVASAICAGLAAAHAAGVVHRDLKPDNVLVARDGRIVVTDFGIARATAALADQGRSTLIVGTPAYMAPEQIEGAAVDARTDLYALGVMLFELVTGELPWKAALGRLASPPPDPRSRVASVPDGIARAIVRCMARDPRNRPDGAEHVAAELASVTLPAPSASRTGGSSVAIVTRPTEPVRGKTVAVLPFRNAGEPGDAYLADSLTDDLIDALSMTKGLKVCARSVVMALNEAAKDPRELGRTLDVQVVVEGSVRRVGPMLRASARLVSVQDGIQVWAKRFDRPEGEALAMNDDAAHAIAAALTLDPSPRTRPAQSDAAAIDLYLRARYELRKYHPKAVVRSIELFEQALSHAPDHPTILSGYALARARYWFNAGAAGAADSGELARRAAERAIAAAPSMGEPHVALAWIQFQSGETAEAIATLRPAITNAPSFAEAHEMLGRILVEIGRTTEGVARLQAAVSLDPMLSYARMDLVRELAFDGKWSAVDGMLEEIATHADPWVVNFYRIRMALWRRGGAPADIPLDDGRSTRFSDFVKVYRDAFAGLKFTRRHAAAVHAFGATGGRRYRLLLGQVAVELAGHARQVDDALDELASVVDAGLVDAAWMDRCPLLEDVRKSERFSELRAKVAQRIGPALETAIRGA